MFTVNCQGTEKSSSRVNRTRSAFSHLQSRFLLRPEIYLGRAYQRMMRSILLDEKMLTISDNDCVHRILRVGCRGRVPAVDVWSHIRFNCEQAQLVQRKLHWVIQFESCAEGELIGGLVLPTPAEEIAIKEDLEHLSAQRYFTVSIEKGLGECFETMSIPFVVPAQPTPYECCRKYKKASVVAVTWYFLILKAHQMHLSHFPGHA